MTTLKQKTISGVIWSAIEKFSVVLGQFVITIILARLLLPSDFGLIGMISIFLVLSQTLIDSGMGSGIIQKKDRTDVDFSTVFVFNFVVSVSLYLVFFLIAPNVADFYGMPKLVSILRVLMLNVIISSLTIVQRTIVLVQVNFKLYAKINLSSVFISGIISIIFAYIGFGVWALVFQYLIKTLIEAILLWRFNKWNFSLRFSLTSFKSLFNYGYKILISGIISKFIYEIYNVIIGKIYSATELGIYSKGKQLAEIIASTITSVVDQVSFPVMASIQGEKTKLANLLEKSIGLTSFIVIPSLTLLVLLSESIVKILLNENWYPVIPIIQIMAIARIFYPISIINMNLLKSIGRSDLFLRINLWKIPLVVIAIIVTIPIGIKAVAIGQIFTSFFGFLINTIYPGKFLNVGLIEQIKVMIPIILSTLITSIIVYFGLSLTGNDYLKIVLGVIVGILFYFLFSHVFKVKEYIILKKIIKDKFQI